MQELISFGITIYKIRQHKKISPFSDKEKGLIFI
jgi:hypothetical protein